MATRVKGFRDIDFGDEFTVSVVGGKAEVSAPLVPASPLPAYTQTYSTVDRTHADLTSVAVATTGSTAVTPFGYTSAAQANAIVTAINALRDDLADAKQLLNAVIDDLQEVGLLG